tara:strand:- start:6264 stop:6641 length:378 start_codon:yes stop_codon:yes gene_type:complete
MENEIIENSDEIDTEEDQVTDALEDQEEEDLADGEEADTEEVETNPVSDLINSIENKDYVTSANIFNDIVGSRLQTALEDEKVAIANKLYNDTPEDTTDEISDEELIDTEEDITAENEEESVAAA